jgi:hypothetical protein
MIELPWGEKWVVRYKEKSGAAGMGMANHWQCLPIMISQILQSGGHGIVITDETIRPKIIDVTGEENEQHSSEVHTRAIGYSPIEEH